MEMENILKTFVRYIIPVGDETFSTSFSLSIKTGVKKPGNYFVLEVCEVFVKKSTKKFHYNWVLLLVTPVLPNYPLLH
jgi:hypothetical protein